jgi:hypothetical protein
MNCTHHPTRCAILESNDRGWSYEASPSVSKGLTILVLRGLDGVVGCREGGVSLGNSSSAADGARHLRTP